MFVNNGIKIIHAGRAFGNMSRNPVFYPKNFTKDHIEIAHMIVRETIGAVYGFDGRKIYCADQKNDDGSFFEITNDYVESYPNGWTTIDEDILVINDKVKEVSIGHPVGDCAVVMAYDKKKKVVSIGHCGHYHTTKMLPVSVIDALTRSYNSNDNDIEVYVAPCADKENYLYETFPAWGDEKVWQGYIKETENELYQIDLKGAINKQLLDRKIKPQNINISTIDTITDDRFYSNYAEKHGDLSKAGRNYMGVVFKNRR